MISGFIRGLGPSSIYRDGRERLEIWIDKKVYADSLPFIRNHRVHVDLIIKDEVYSAGLRETEKNPVIWICPDLRDKNDKRTNLAIVLNKAGYMKNQKIQMNVKGKMIQIIG